MTLRQDILCDMVKELILTQYPHLRGEVHVRITSKPVLYEVHKGVGLIVEIGMETTTHARRREIIARCGKAAQEVHAGLTHARKVTGISEMQS